MNNPFSLWESLRENIGNFEIQAEEKGLVFRCDIGDNVFDDLVGDRDKRMQVLHNPAANCIKYSEQASGELMIEAKQIANEKKVQLEFSFTETGIGIALEKQKTIF